MSTHPWDRLPGETGTQYAHFLAYRDLGPSRSIRRAYRRTRPRLEGHPQGGKREVPGSFWALAARHRWKERAGAWT